MTEKQNIQIDELLFEFYGDEVPSYVKNAGKDFIDIGISDWSGAKLLRITIKDVIRYYLKEAHNIVSGCRTIAGHTGDWRPIDNLASECLEFFKVVNKTALAREGKKYGMELKN